MLTLRQIVKACEEGIEVKFRRKSHPLGWKGEYDPENKLVSVYKPAIESKEDLELTLLHEFVHARDDVKGGREGNETETELEAIDTYHKNYSVLEFIKGVYNLKY